MSHTADLRPVRPRLAFRVGVIGSRHLPQATLPAIETQVRAVLGLVRDEMSEAGRRPEARLVYADSHTGPLKPWLRILSPLANGADQLVARIALQLGFELEVVLPFAQEEYERSMDDGSVAAFRALLDQASDGSTASSSRVVTLDGHFGDDANLSYQAVGRLVVRNCDLLVAIWDGNVDRGVGGTADTVGFAAAGGQAVWQIDPTVAREPSLIEAASHLRWPERASAGAAAADALRGRIRHLVLPPSIHRRRGHHGVLGRIAGRGAPNPLQVFMQERIAAPGFFGRMFDASGESVLQAAAWVGRGGRSPPFSPASTGTTALPGLTNGVPWAATVWEPAYAAPNALAGVYAARYRSTYTLVVLLSALTLLIATATLDAEGWAKIAFTFAELSLLAAIALLVLTNERRRWHERWIAYRLIAEICRKQEALASLGWSQPSWSGARAPAPSEPSEAAEDGGYASWAGWYVEAVARAMPLPTGTLSGRGLDAVRDKVLHTLLHGQRAYHLGRAGRYRAASRGLSGIGESLFFATVALVACKMMLILLHGAPGLVHFVGQAAALLATPSAACVALRAYAELDILAEQSSSMARILGATEARIRDMAADRPLVSQEIGREIAQLADAMLQDIEGWARLAQVKAVEAG